MSASNSQTTPLSVTAPAPGIEWQGILMVIIGAFCFSTAIIFTRLTDGLGVATIAFFRSVFAFLFLCTLMIRFREPLHVASYRPVIKTLIATGIVMSMTVSLYTYSIQHTTAANAALLVNSAPIYVAVLAPVVLKEKPARYTWASLALAIVGIVLVSNPADLDLKSSSMGGIIAGALSGFTYSFVMMLGRSLRGRVSGLTQTLWSIGITALVLLPFALRSPGSAIASNIPVLIPLGIFSLGLSYLLYFLGLQRISAQMVSVVALFEPVSGVLIGLFMFQEIPTVVSAIGGVMILGSIYLISK